MHSFYLDAIRNFEGYTPKAQWDYAQHTNGFGTRALYPGEMIDKAEAERRFQSEITAARSIVEKAAPNVDEGTKAALTSLTYNAGSAWIGSGLGDAIRHGDLAAAREIFVKYNKAGGEVLPGLVSRRSQEALWIGDPNAVASGTSAAVADASTPLPAILVHQDAVSRANSAQNVRVIDRSDAPPGLGETLVRAPRVERVATAEAADTARALLAVIQSQGLSSGSAATDVVRLANLGRGSDLARGEREDAQNETRRV